MARDVFCKGRTVRAANRHRLTKLLLGALITFSNYTTTMDVAYDPMLREGLALSDTFDNLNGGRQSAQAGDSPALQREVERRRNEGEGYTSDSLTEAPSGSDEHAELRRLGMIWTGCYTFSCQLQPPDSSLGWAAGKSPLPRRDSADLLLCTLAFAKKHRVQLRSLHARFNFDPENRAFYVAGTSNSQHTVLTVNGTAVTRRLHALNQHNMNIRFDKLEYVFQYTSYAATDGFTRERADYQTRIMNCPQLIDFEMPTPQVSTRIIGPWTLANPLGRGGMDLP
ncbi:hypothetical protein GGTG_04667 [Gaeumannomyces tritici R3-111a-1]|uniref:Uncharacterized protein n=1 Tax=Gaeumannomyces tritici (strain R3-111a-1) TaxID=644352 RepID=J3NTR7_GAET3|nr:hypothetical protein GGTG_04667 [Gaeumannomyces tritici R3-111a-1]EJT79582.1 hypothetical protein GGTG_04667 [Gaeumannomyces tritici R3-111a-1]